MIARDVRARSGITLTEILIAILIMGVGLISLATLFPLGLLRLREATRNSRAGLTFETAADEMDTRNLFDRQTFTQTWYWYPQTVGNTTQIVPRDPFVQDALPNGGVAGVISSNPVSTNGINTVTKTPLMLSGLPFCYDPLWRSITNVMPNTGLADPTLSFAASYVNGMTPDEARFGAGIFSNGSIPFIRADPDGGNPSAHGLQRLTNFIPWANPALTPCQNSRYPFTSMNSFYQQQFATLTGAQKFSYLQPPDFTGATFTSPDDIVFNAFTGNPNAGSPLLPDMTQGTPQADYRFTWFITGHQADAGGNGSQFVGEVVVCDGRPFGWDPLPGQTFNGPAGETAVEAIFGYGKVPGPAGTTGFAAGSDRTVLLRWPTTMPDPTVRVGGWICDVTYERSTALCSSRTTSGVTTFARCYWYQIGKRTEPQADITGIASSTPYRSMVLTITSPVRAKTLLSGGVPVHVNVALVMPSVINVYPRAFETIPYQVP